VPCLQPLLAQSYLIYRWLQDNDCFGAEQDHRGQRVVKTGLGLCRLSDRNPSASAFQIVGLTSVSVTALCRRVGAFAIPC